MKDILIIGGGKIGETIARFLSTTGDYALTVADRSRDVLARLSGELADDKTIRPLVLDASDAKALKDAMAGRFAVINASPYFLTLPIAQAARAAEIHYLDLTEDVRATAEVRAIATGAATAFIPQCGLAPGYISIVANDLARRFETLDSVRMRVGALPIYPTNALKYNLTWSTEGLINEYCQPGDAIVDGKPAKTLPLEGREEFSLDGIRYEAFNTSGGLGTLCDTFKGKVRTMDYRSVRYPGHRDVMKVLLHDLELSDRQELLKDILENAIPATMQDVVLIFVTVSGTRSDRLLQESYAAKIYNRVIDGAHLSGIQITTASGICAVLDLLAEGAIAQSGLVRQEDIVLDDFLANRFGGNFANAEKPRHGGLISADAA